MYESKTVPIIRIPELTTELMLMVRYFFGIDADLYPKDFIWTEALSDYVVLNFRSEESDIAKSIVEISRTKCMYTCVIEVNNMLAYAMARTKRRHSAFTVDTFVYEYATVELLAHLYLAGITIAYLRHQKDQENDAMHVDECVEAMLTRKSESVLLRSRIRYFGTINNCLDKLEFQNPSINTDILTRKLTWLFKKNLLTDNLIPIRIMDGDPNLQFAKLHKTD